MKHFVCEFITAGGLRAHPLSSSLAHQGGLMLHTLATELTEGRGGELSATHDNRIPAVVPGSLAMAEDDDVWQIWAACIDECDYFWPIAPETNGELYRLTRLAQAKSCRLIGSTAEAVTSCANKSNFAALLADNNIPVIATYRLSDAIPYSESGWIIKPEVGAGCEECYHAHDRRQLRAFMQLCEPPSAYIVQPYMAGIALSLSILVYHDAFTILACNRQEIREKNNYLHLTGLAVNAFAERRRDYYPIVARIIETVGGLAGFVGIDVVMDGQEIHVVELNPRITTAFSGLSRSLGSNISGMMLSMFTDQRMPALPSTARPVHINLS